MELPLVVGVDGSNGSLHAVDWAVDEAVRHGLPLRLVYASLWERYEGVAPETSPERPSEQLLAEHIVGAAVERARQRNRDVKIATDTIPADAVSALLEEGRHAAALVTGSRGRGELRGLLLGSVGLAVSARAQCPVIVVRGDPAGLAGTHGRILLGAGEPEACGEAVRFAFREAEARGCTLDVVRAWRRPAYEPPVHRAAAQEPARQHEEQASAVLDALLAGVTADHPGVRTSRTTVEGSARRVLVHRSAAADLVILGSRHRSGPFGLQLGRVSHTLLHHAACPVAVVPQPG
ncbi:universal stress protein [Streptomyces spinoverrucosus]|uniref:Universal stress protein n=1 Tax=Streptomyces spinoverrucosus TaxID=284043 RepID=A0A4Y3VA71_9ACTN|nr:universal stress protein [Streptomyces spinoverrucosus]GEC02690.1 universal stress protein [Streptomyces spinoverrucosus]GHB41196.1 universal stress protein [Streptomyces spinoverrucosus]